MEKTLGNPTRSKHANSNTHPHLSQSDTPLWLMKTVTFFCDVNRQQLLNMRVFLLEAELSRTYSKGPQATHADGSDGWLRRTQPQTETQLVICSVVWQSVPPLTLTLYLHAHNDWLCLALALPRFSVSLLLLFKFWFPTRLSSPPSFSVRSDCPAFLTFQLRMLEIPSSCCGLAKSLLLFHPSVLRPFPTYLPVFIWSAADEPDQTATAPVTITFTSRLLFAFSLFLKRESDCASWQSALRPWDELLYVQQRCTKR